MSDRLKRLLAIVFALSLFATACGSDAAETATDDTATTDTADDAEETDADDTAADDAPGTAADTDIEDTNDAPDNDADTDAGVLTASIEELEADWAAQRAEIVAEITAAGYGRDGDTLTGPGGWTVDLSECPADWSDTAGINDGTVTIGLTLPQSGPLAANASIGEGMEAYFDYVNDHGGIGADGLQLSMITKDDAYVATQTQELVAELLQTNEPFFLTTLGSPNTFAVQGTLNDGCIPQTSMSGHQAWGDPDNFPWTVGLQLSYLSEARLWGAWIDQNMEPGAKVAALVMDNDFGLAYEKAFEAYADGSDIIESVQFVRHDPAAATLTNELTTLASGSPNVFITMTTGNPCVLAIEEASRSGMTDIVDASFLSSTCKSVSAYMAPPGDASDGWLIWGGGWKDSADAQYADDTYIKWMNESIDAAGLDSGVSLNSVGFGTYAWPEVQALMIAAELEGGLTRSNLMLALRSLHLDNPGLLPGIPYAMDGSNDAYFVEGSDLSRFSVAEQSWIIEDVVDLNGTSPNCPWVAGEGC